MYPPTHSLSPELSLHVFFGPGFALSGHIHIPSRQVYIHDWLHAPHCAASARRLTHPLPGQKPDEVALRMHAVEVLLEGWATAEVEIDIETTVTKDVVIGWLANVVKEVCSIDGGLMKVVE